MILRANDAYLLLCRTYMHSVDVATHDNGALYVMREWCKEQWGRGGCHLEKANEHWSSECTYDVDVKHRWAAISNTFFFRFGRDASMFKLFWG